MSRKIDDLKWRQFLNLLKLKGRKDTAKKLEKAVQKKLQGVPKKVVDGLKYRDVLTSINLVNILSIKDRKVKPWVQRRVEQLMLQGYTVYVNHSRVVE